ncbi:sodium:proton antiporter, partial [Methylobacterium sp. DB1607]|nr:sodium:proton antiporter [Methylobacterium sp. DB1607]
AFLLFAGAMSLDLRALRARAWPVATLALLGTLISTALVGIAFWWAADALGQPLWLAWALVFGALISPTDPVAVLATLKNVRVPEALEVEMQGEALFNDGIGIVLFTVLLAFAAGSNGEATSVGGIARLLLQEAGGGLLLGIVTGYLAYRAMRAIDDFPVEVLITLALVAGTYALAQKLHASGPLAVVAAGLLVGDRAPRDAMSEETQGYVSSLWTLIDEVLNSVLFLLIGLEVLVLRFEASGLLLAACAVPIVLLARLVAVSTPLLVFRWGGNLSARNVPFLTWAGVRGGISVALALSMPESEAKAAILASTYAVVLFTIVVQGSTLGFVARRTLAGRPQASDG